MRETTIVFKVLSEEPIPEAMDLLDIVGEGIDGDFVLDTSPAWESRELEPQEMADALLAAGSDPSFFGLEDVLKEA